MICADRDEGVGRRAAVHAGVKIGFGAADFDLGVDHAAQADAEGGQAGREELGVGDKREVGLEIGGLWRQRSQQFPPLPLLPRLRKGRGH